MESWELRIQLQQVPLMASYLLQQSKNQFDYRSGSVSLPIMFRVPELWDIIQADQKISQTIKFAWLWFKGVCRSAMDQPITPTAQWASSASLLVGNRSALDDNSSDEELLDLSVFLRFASNRRVNDTAYYSLICAYSLLIIMGAAGNLLVVYAVVRQPAMRTVRNVFIINLAVSDLLLCVVTMPLTLMEVLSNTWQLGNTPFLCQMVGGMQAVSIFVSTMSIAAIAVDRYQLIVNPTESSFERAGALTTLIAIWVLRWEET